MYISEKGAIILIDLRCAVIIVIAKDIAEQGGFRCRGCIRRAADERNREARQTGTTRERALADGGHAIGDRDLGQTRTTGECIVADLRYTACNNDGGNLTVTVILIGCGLYKLQLPYPLLFPWR